MPRLATAAHIDTLCDDILFSIFLYLDMKQLLRVGKVCRRWDTLINVLTYFEAQLI